jgi:hypothetical protein
MAHISEEETPNIELVKNPVTNAEHGTNLL